MVYGCQSKHLARLTEFMKTSKVCYTVSDCSMTLDTESGPTIYNRGAILADGTVFLIHFSTPNYNPGAILVDIDGTNKGKNKVGIDTFEFLYNHANGVHVRTSNNDNDYVSLNLKQVRRATAWVINFDNMDYLKTTDGTTCPDGTKLTFGGNHSCK